MNVGNPRHKKTVSGSVLCCHDRGMSAKSANIWLSGQHVADMSALFSANYYVTLYSVSISWVLYISTDSQTRDRFFEFPGISDQVGIGRIPSTHAETKITIHSHKNSFTPYRSLSPYSLTDRHSVIRSCIMSLTTLIFC